MEQEQDPNQVFLPPRVQNPKSKGESRIQCVDLEVLRWIEVKITKFEVEMEKGGREVILGLEIRFRMKKNQRTPFYSVLIAHKKFQKNTLDIGSWKNGIPVSLKKKLLFAGYR